MHFQCNNDILSLWRHKQKKILFIFRLSYYSSRQIYSANCLEKSVGGGYQKCKQKNGCSKNKFLHLSHFIIHVKSLGGRGVWERGNWEFLYMGISCPWTAQKKTQQQHVWWCQEIFCISDSHHSNLWQLCYKSVQRRMPTNNAFWKREWNLFFLERIHSTSVCSSRLFSTKSHGPFGWQRCCFTSLFVKTPSIQQLSEPKAVVDQNAYTKGFNVNMTWQLYL